MPIQTHLLEDTILLIKIEINIKQAIFVHLYRRKNFAYILVLRISDMKPNGSKIFPLYFLIILDEKSILSQVNLRKFSPLRSLMIKFHDHNCNLLCVYMDYDARKRTSSHQLLFELDCA